MRFIFVVEMTTAPSGGTAPPASPVPEPRATNGTPWRSAIAHARLDLLRRRREADGDGGALHVRGVVAVERQLGRAVADAVGARAPGAARRRARRSTGHSVAARGRRIRITRPDSTGSPSTSTSSPGGGGRRGARGARRARRAARARGPGRRARPSRTASATRRAERLTEPTAPRATLAGASLRAVARDLALGVAGAGGAGGDAAGEPHGAAHHAPRRNRRTARDVPVASPAALIIGADSVVRATRPLGRPWR